MPANACKKECIRCPYMSRAFLVLLGYSPLSLASYLVLLQSARILCLRSFRWPACFRALGKSWRRVASLQWSTSSNTRRGNKVALCSATRSILRRPPLDKLLQVRPRGDSQHEAAILVGDDCERLLLAAGLGAFEEGLELLERRVHGDDLVLAALALEPDHGGADGVLRPDLALVEQGLQVRDGDVAQQGAGLAVDDGQVRVVAFEGEGEGEGDGVGRREGQGGGGLEVFYCGLSRGKEAMYLSVGFVMIHMGEDEERMGMVASCLQDSDRTPR